MNHSGTLYPMEELERADELAPTARNYTRHTLYSAHSGTLGELLCALYPCPLTYREIGLRLKDDVKPEESHPFKEWIEFHADPVVGDICREFARCPDGLAERAGKDGRELHYKLPDGVPVLEDGQRARGMAGLVRS